MTERGCPVRGGVAAVAAAVMLVACGSGTTSPSGKQTMVQENSSPAGFIAGRVRDASDGKPIAGALVTTLSDATVSAASDPNGLFKLGPLPLGTYVVFFEGPGFIKRAFPVTLVSTGGMFPVGNSIVTLDVDMARGDAVIEGQVLTSTGNVAKGASLFVDLRQQNYDVVATTKADENGKFRFAGMPGSAFGEFVQVQVAPFDENGDGVPDYSQGQRTYTLFPATTTYNTISLFALGVTLVTSNISDTDLLPTESISLTFSGSVRTGQSTVTLIRNAGSVLVGTMLSWDATNSIATLTPVGGPLVEGQAYQVSYAVRAVNGALSQSTLQFTCRPPGGQPPLGSVNNFRLTSVAMPDSQTQTVSVAWDPVMGAGGYRIYGKDTAMGSAYLLLTTISSGLQTTATPSLFNFDSIASDGFTTPLGHKNKVKLAIVATDRLFNETSFMTAGTIELVDVTPPTVASAFQQSGSAGNLTGGSAATVVYVVNFSEPMNPDAQPQIILPNATTSAVWAWTSVVRGQFTITVPAGVDGRGMVQITSGKDTNDLVQMAAWDGPLQ